MATSNVTVYKWQVWCTIESKWEYVWAENEPSLCPNDSAHPLDPTRTSIVETVTADTPKSEVGNKIWVHSSSKPEHEGKVFYVQWIGAGDDMTTGDIGEGEILHFSNEPGVLHMQKDLKFHPDNGLVYLHEGYSCYENAGDGDYIDMFIMAEPTQVQPYANLDLIIDPNNGEVVYSPNGPGTGTHGFAATPVLVDRRFTKTGYWDYDEINSLRPNFTKTGEYDIYTTESIVHRLVVKVPVCGSSGGMRRLVSEDTTQLPSGYFVRLATTNTSNTNWHASFVVCVYREKTFTPHHSS